MPKHTFGESLEHSNVKAIVVLISITFKKHEVLKQEVQSLKSTGRANFLMKNFASIQNLFLSHI